MKSKIALLALAFILMFGTTTSIGTAAVITATTGVSLTPISLTDAYYGSAPVSLCVTTSPTTIYVSSNVNGEADQFFRLDSMNVCLIVNGNQISNETYTTWNMTGLYGRIGFYGEDYYTVGAMNSGLILSGYGTRDSFSPYTIAIPSGGTLEARVTWNIQGYSPVTSSATISYVPESTTAGLIAASTILTFLRRKRK